MVFSNNRTYSNLCIISNRNFILQYGDLTDTSNAAVDLTNYTGYGQIKKTYASSSKTDFTVTKDSNDLIIQLSEAQTKALKAGRYVYDIIIDNGVTRTKVLEGQLHVEDSVTSDSP